MRTVTTISSVIRASEVRRARRAVPLVTHSLFQHPLRTNVPLRSHTPASPQPRPSLAPASHRPCPDLTLAAPQPRPDLAPASHQPRPGNFARNSFSQQFNNRHKRCNTNDSISLFERYARELRARLLGKHDTKAGANTARPRPENPATASSIDADQMRKGSFFTNPRPFHHEPRPSVSPALVSGIRIRTSA